MLGSTPFICAPLHDIRVEDRNRPRQSGAALGNRKLFSDSPPLARDYADCLSGEHQYSREKIPRLWRSWETTLRTTSRQKVECSRLRRVRCSVDTSPGAQTNMLLFVNMRVGTAIHHRSHRECKCISLTRSLDQFSTRLSNKRWWYHPHRPEHWSCPTTAHQN